MKCIYYFEYYLLTTFWFSKKYQESVFLLENSNKLFKTTLFSLYYFIRACAFSVMHLNTNILFSAFMGVFFNGMRLLLNISASVREMDRIREIKQNICFEVHML